VAGNRARGCATRERRGASMGVPFALSRVGKEVVWFKAGGAELLVPQPPQPQPPQPPPQPSDLCTNFSTGHGCRSLLGVINWGKQNASRIKRLCDPCAQEGQKERRRASADAARALLRAPSTSIAGELALVQQCLRLGVRLLFAFFPTHCVLCAVCWHTRRRRRRRRRRSRSRRRRRSRSFVGAKRRGGYRYVS
jgi:hypothetical protein